MNKITKNLLMLTLSFLLLSCVTTKGTEEKESKKTSDKKSEYKMIEKKESLYYLETQIKYPYFEDYEELSKRVSATVESNHKNFKSFCKEEWDSINAYNSSENSKSRLPPFEYLVDSFVTYSDQYISVYLETYIFNGGAHGNISIQTFCYDTQKNAFSNIREATGFSYKDLSEKCKETLIERLVSSDSSLTKVQKETFLESINTEVFPQASNFERFTLDKNIVNIYYEPYSVAPYSYGIQVVSYKFK